MSQQAQPQQLHLHPKTNGSAAQAAQLLIIVEQTVVDAEHEVWTVGPITLPLPGYSLLLRFDGRNGAITYPQTIVVAVPTD